MSEISVIMNCYNGEAFLEEAIASVVSQSFQDWELVFWDNRSTDGSAAIVEGRAVADSRIRYLQAPEHTPLSDARNLAIAAAESSWVALLDTDDRWDSDKLEKQMALAERFPDAGVLSCRHRKLFRPDPAADWVTEEAPAGPGEPFLEGARAREVLLQGNFISSASMVMRKELVESVGGFQSGQRYAGEYDLMLRLTAVTGFARAAEPLCDYRVHGRNATLELAAVADREVIAVLRRYEEQPGVREVIRDREQLCRTKEFLGAGPAGKARMLIPSLPALVGTGLRWAARRRNKPDRATAK